MGNRGVEVGIGTNFEGKVHLAIELISTVRSLKDQKQISCVAWQNPRLMVRQSSECGLLSDRQSQTLFQRPRSPSPESRRGVPQFQTRVGRQRGRTFVPWRRRSNCLKMSPTQFCLSSFNTCWLLFLFQSNQTFRVEVNLCYGRLLVRDCWATLQGRQESGLWSSQESKAFLSIKSFFAQLGQFCQIAKVSLVLFVFPQDGCFEAHPVWGACFFGLSVLDALTREFVI